MARNSKSSLSSDLLDIATSLSWKISIPIAIAAYFGFHYLSLMELPTAIDAKATIGNAPMQIGISLAKLFQYVVPFVFIIGAIMSAAKGGHRRKLLDQQTGLNSIRSMSWQEFEMLVGEAYKRKGYIVRENGGGGADGGIDLFLSKNGKRTIVQCKRWKTNSINVSLVRELYGVMTGERATACIFVTSGTYTAEARLFAQGKPITLVDGEALFELIASVRNNISMPKIDAFQPVATNIQKGAFSCPDCGGDMVKRTAKRGANAGKEFLGCSNYPKCKATVHL
jgi:restriction system protein